MQHFLMRAFFLHKILLFSLSLSLVASSYGNCVLFCTCLYVCERKRKKNYIHRYTSFTIVVCIDKWVEKKRSFSMFIQSFLELTVEQFAYIPLCTCTIIVLIRNDRRKREREEFIFNDIHSSLLLSD